MPQSAFRIGFVGVGRMGANMARRLKEQHHVISAVFDIDTDQAARLADELACQAVPTLDEVTRLAETVVTVVSDDAAMRRIYAPDLPDSLLEHSSTRPAACSSIAPPSRRRSMLRFRPPSNERAARALKPA